MSLSTILSNYSYLADLIVNAVRKFKEDNPNDEPFFMIKCYKKSRISDADLNPNWRIRRETTTKRVINEDLLVEDISIKKRHIKKTTTRRVEKNSADSAFNVRRGKPIKEFIEVIDEEIITKTIQPEKLEYNLTFVDHEPYNIESVLLHKEVLTHSVGKYWSKDHEDSALVSINDPEGLNLIKSGDLDSAHVVANRVFKDTSKPLIMSDVCDVEEYPSTIKQMTVINAALKYLDNQKNLNKMKRKITPILNDLIDNWDEILSEYGLFNGIAQALSDIKEDYT